MRNGQHREQQAGRSHGTNIAIFGAAPDTCNMGVKALFCSAAASIQHAIPDVKFTVFDNGLGRRDSRILVGNDLEIEIEQRGARAGLRLMRPENLASMALMSKLGEFGARANANVRAIDQADAVLDLSGGDSFTDLYGIKRFLSVAQPKLISIRRRTPLILLPQTYGPYASQWVRSMAARAVCGATMCWARDERSFSIMQDLLADRFDPLRHRCGVDLAFGLEPRPASHVIPNSVRQMLNADRNETPLVGFNVSGLIYNDPAGARLRYSLRADYPKLVVGFLRRLLRSHPINLVLVPHVLGRINGLESDLAACQQVIAELAGDFGSRVTMSPSNLDQCQLKWLIGQTDWFCGTRMHSTIAALSSGVPTATVSYSDKSLGVFESCCQGEHVIDPRRYDTSQMIERLDISFAKRESAKKSLAAQLPRIKARFQEQVRAIASQVETVILRRQQHVTGVRYG